jgi:WD40 repeat protein
MYKVLLNVCCLFLLSWGYSTGSDRVMLIFAPMGDSEYTFVLRIYPNGKIEDTGQKLKTGYDSIYGGVSPSQEYYLMNPYRSLSQYRIESDGTVSLMTIYQTLTSRDTKYLPNGKMVISSDTGQTFRVLENGSLEFTGNFYGGNPVFYNVTGEMICIFCNRGMKVYSVDTQLWKLNLKQEVPWNDSNFDPTMSGLGTFSPDGKEFIVSGIGKGQIRVYSVKSDWTLDTAYYTVYFPGEYSSRSMFWSLDEKDLFVVCESSDKICLVSRDTNTGLWKDSGKRWAVGDGPWTVKRTPDWNLVVVDELDAKTFKKELVTYRLTPLNDLEPTGYRFPFQETFGGIPNNFDIAYPKAATSVPESAWRKEE